MAKSIAIGILSTLVVVLTCLWVRSAVSMVERDITQKAVRHSGYEVWRLACEHAAQGNRDRLKWCALADHETDQQDRFTEEESEALALRLFKQNPGRQLPSSK